MTVYRRIRSLTLLTAAVLALELLLPGGPAKAEGQTHQDDTAPTISIVSSRPDTITGGDALVKVEFSGSDPDDFTVTAGGSAHTDAFSADADSGALIGLVTGLPLGESEIRVSTAGGAGAALAVTNYPITGPLFSGPHEEPYLCETGQSTIPVIGTPIGAPLDADCSIAGRVDYYYQTAKGVNTPWPDDATETGQYPADLKYVTTGDGFQAPFIVRLETTTVNRAIAQTTILHDPIAEPEPSPSRHPAAWNGSAYLMFSGGPPGGWYRQGVRTATSLTPTCSRRATR